MNARSICGVPYVFARQKLRKPFHEEVVTLEQRPVLCHNGCGLFYIPTLEQLEQGKTRGAVACPDCHAPAKPHRIGAVEQIEVTVRMQFGNLTDVSFLRALGSISRRRMTTTLVHESRVSISPPKEH